MRIDNSHSRSTASEKVFRAHAGDQKADAAELGVAGIKQLHEDIAMPEDGHGDEVLNKSVEQANKTLEVYDKMIERTVHEKTRTIMYTLKDTKTNEVIREFPPKKIQDMIAKMWELAGLFVDEKA